MKKWFKRLSQTICECKYHVVFCPKYRYRIFSGEVAAYGRQHLNQLSGQKEKVETSNRVPFRTYLYQATVSGGGTLTILQALQHIMGKLKADQYEMKFKGQLPE